MMNFNQSLSQSLTSSELFAGLMSAKRQLTEDKLRRFALNRGLFFSPHETREAICEELSLLQYSFKEYEELGSLAQSASRRKRSTQAQIQSSQNIGDIDLQNSLKAISDSAEEGVVINFKMSNNGGAEVTVKHQEIDWAKTPLHAKKEVVSEYQIDPIEGGNIAVRGPSINYSNVFIGKLSDNLPGTSKVREMTLAGLPDDDSRAIFFRQLFIECESVNYKITSVVSVKVIHSSKLELIAATGGGEEKEENPFVSSQAAQLLDAALNGQNILETNEYKNLKSNGFLIYDIRFHAAVDTGDIVDFKMGFRADEQGTHRLQYDAMQIRKSGNRSFKAISNLARRSLIKELEAAAWAAYVHARE